MATIDESDFDTYDTDYLRSAKQTPGIKAELARRDAAEAARGRCDECWHLGHVHAAECSQTPKPVVPPPPTINDVLERVKLLPGDSEFNDTRALAAEVVRLREALKEAVRKTLDKAELAARRAPLPAGYQWGEDAKDNFRVGTGRAGDAIAALPSDVP